MAHRKFQAHYHPALAAWFWWTHAAIPFLLALFMAFIYPKTGLDHWLIAPYFDQELKRFPLKNDTFVSLIMHTGMNRMLILMEVLVIAAYAVSLFRPTLQRFRRPCSWLAITMLAGPMFISYLKQHSVHECPWNLIEYGGTMLQLGFFDILPIGAEAGRCFPGGHASGGFALFAGYFLLRDRNKRQAIICLFAAMLLGMCMGWSQMARGAHFFSHNVWSGLIVWTVCLVLYLTWPPYGSKMSQEASDGAFARVRDRCAFRYDGR